jgi:streptogramin lyase
MMIKRSFGFLLGVMLAAPLAVSPVDAAPIVTDYTLAPGARPQSVAVDSNGNVYSANRSASTVSKVTPGGEVTRTWATLDSSPGAIAVDSRDNVYTANGDRTISKITPAGVVDRAWASLPGIMGGLTTMAIDTQGNVFAGSHSNLVLSKVTAEGVATPFWALLGGSPQDIAVDGAGTVYVAQFANSTVGRVTPDGTVTPSWATLASAAAPTGIAVDSLGNVFTANVNNRTVSKITSAGTLTRNWVVLNPDSGPIDIAIDNADVIYTANNNDQTVSRITPTGQVTQKWATLAEGSTPQAIAVSSTSAFVANPGRDTVSMVPLATAPSSPSAPIAALEPPTGASLAWTAPEDTGSSRITGYVVRRFRDGSATPEATLALQTAVTSFTDTGLSRGSAYRYTVAAVNSAGEGPPSTSSASVLPGTSTPPGTATGVTINAGASFTNTKIVELSVSWPATASSMHISNDGGFIPTLTRTYDVQENVSWTLDDSVAGKNTKIVYVRFEGVNVDSTRTYSDDIILDTVAPVITSVTAVGQGRASEASALSAKAAPSSRKVVVRTRAKDKISGVSRIQVTNTRRGSGGVVKPFRKSIVVKQKAATRRVFVRVADKAGNWSKRKPVAIR